jgi:hypothetical protein
MTSREFNYHNRLTPILHLANPKPKVIAVCTLIKHTHDPGCVAALRAATQQTVLNALAKRYATASQQQLWILEI